MQIGFLGLLTLVFVACKLTGVIAWSWFWVLSPLLLGVVLFFVAMAAALAFAFWAER